MRRRISITLALLAAAGCAEQPTAPAVPAAQLARAPRSSAIVHLIYLVPADRVARRDHARDIEGAIEHLQIWYRNELGTGRTFSLDKRVVRTYVTEHAASWYATTPRTDYPEWLWFWGNALQEGFALTGGGFDDPDDIWIFYIDADEACGQGVGAAAGVALLPANDLRGLAGEVPLDPCTGQPIQDPGVCRWIGGLGHELGHAFGLPHPPGCEEGDAACPLGTLMWFGYITYPNTFFTSDDRATLATSPFFSSLKLRSRLPKCASNLTWTPFGGASYSIAGGESAPARACLYDRLEEALRSHGT